jgi:hypothetical protein
MVIPLKCYVLNIHSLQLIVNSLFIKINTLQEKNMKLESAAIVTVSSILIAVAFLSGAFMSEVVAQERLMHIDRNVSAYVKQQQAEPDTQVALDLIMQLTIENIRLKKAVGITE